MRRLLMTLLLFCLVRSTGQTNYFITSADGTKLYIQEWGNGKPVILLAGGPGLNAIYMDSVWLHLSLMFRCIVIDQRGTGKTTIASLDSQALSMNNYINDLEALRKRLHLEKLTLIGHSWGGMLAMDYAGKYPNHVNKLVPLNWEVLGFSN
ncbi:MAG: alpha/beta fold hydrolase [Segetibacter sp.]